MTANSKRVLGRKAVCCSIDPSYHAFLARIRRIFEKILSASTGHRNSMMASSFKTLKLEDQKQL